MSEVEPEIVDCRVDASSAELDLTIPAGLKYLRGHFPGNPIVPGVVQIKWALDAAIRQLGVPENVLALEVLKFNRILRPGDEVTLSLRFDESKRKLHFSYRSETGPHSSGRIVFEATD